MSTTLDVPAPWQERTVPTMSGQRVRLRSPYRKLYAATAITRSRPRNIITVSLRQTVIPSRLLGRVNSVYRFFAWGMMPVGALLGGLIVVAAAVGP